MDKLITAVITTYKREKDIVERALRSALSQNYRPLEVIVVDDNRDDEEGRAASAVLKDLVDELSGAFPGIPLTLCSTYEGRHGAQAARNTGIKNARGFYIAFLDDDDEWLPGKLEKQSVILEKHPECGMCFCRGWKIDESVNPPVKEDYQGEEFRSTVSYRMLLRGDCIGTTSQAMIPAAVFDRVGLFDERLPARQDYEMWIRIARAMPIAGCSAHLFRIFKNGGREQISRNWDNCIKGHILLYRKYKKDIDSDRRAKFNVAFYLAHYHMCKGDKKRMVRLYARSFFISPVCFWGKFRIKLSEIMRRHRRGDVARS